MGTTCYYEELELERDATDAEIKSAYRRLAMRWHPDKHVTGDADAQHAAHVKFQQVQHAYSVLSDAHERAWYDAHRDDILRGDEYDSFDEQGDDLKPCSAARATKLHLYKYFSASAFAGFDEVEEPEKNFFSVFRAVFSQLDEEERHDLQYNSNASNRASAGAFAPSFGRADSAWGEVRDFYGYYDHFNSRLTFAFGDKWKLSDAPNRDIRRAMEKENTRERARLRKEFNAQVRELVAYVKKRDPRVEAQRVAEAERRERERLRVQEEAEQRKKLKQAMLAEYANDADMQQEWRRVDELISELGLGENEAAAGAARANGSAAGGEHASGVEDIQARDVKWDCEVCSKTFRSQKQLQNHENSRKHLENMHLLHERTLELLAEQELGEDEHAGGQNNIGHDTSEISAQSDRAVGDGQDGSVDDEALEEELDAFSKKKSKKKDKKNKKRIGAGFRVETYDKTPSPPSPATGSVASDAELDTLPEETLGTNPRQGHEQELQDYEQQSEPLSAPIMKQKKPTRAKLKKEQRRLARENGDKDTEQPAAADTTVKNELICTSCGLVCTSRNALFTHLKKNPAHAVYK
ncbi:DnaJ-like subfamily C member 21 [Porphyridium purpureum]|uniref:DnaJ-like subfamily C member 21 n=1 Tax=Porphyridium purpureum TaxID=35688 RepID=A0A5J4YQH8_PORPP|nr:DnaJ-like subfamily C member 21 [Porphyridium purpureum]|eukprot:POR1872..scf295_9